MMHTDLEANTLAAYHPLPNIGYETGVGKIGRVFLWAVALQRETPEGLDPFAMANRWSKFLDVCHCQGTKTLCTG